MTGEEIEAIVNGYHGDAFGILGPHAVRKKGRQPRWEVRAFLPHAESPRSWWSAARGARWRRSTRKASSCALPGWRPVAYRISRAPVGRPRSRDRRPVPLRSADLRIRPLPAHRRHALRGLAHARRAHRGERRRERRALRGVGAECGERRRWPASSTIGTRAATPCGGATAACGRSSCPGSATGASYKYNVRSRFAGIPAAEGRPVRVLLRTAAEIGIAWCGTSQYEWQDAAWMEARADDRPAEVADVGLRSAPGKLDARPDGPDRSRTANWRSSWWNT